MKVAGHVSCPPVDGRGAAMRRLIDTLLDWMRPAVAIRWAVFVAVMLVWWLVLNYATVREWVRAREQRDAYAAEVARLEAEHADLQRERVALEAGGFAAEKAARERLLMSRPDEKVIFIEPPEMNDESE